MIGTGGATNAKGGATGTGGAAGAGPGGGVTGTDGASGIECNDTIGCPGGGGFECRSSACVNGRCVISDLTCNLAQCPASGTGTPCCLTGPTLCGSCGVDYGKGCVTVSALDAGPPYDCVVNGGSTAVVHDLDAYCRTVSCKPAALDAALSGYRCTTADAGAGNHTFKRTVGCGFETLSYGGILYISDFIYEASTGKLVGVVSGNDQPFGPCNVATYYVGEVPPPCANEVLYACDAAVVDGGMR